MMAASKPTFRTKFIAYFLTYSHVVAVVYLDDIVHWRFWRFSVERAANDRIQVYLELFKFR